MQTITFSCEVIAPMFLGNAIEKQVELRGPAIKAALRFWWRAMHGNLLLEDTINEQGEITTKGLRTFCCELVKVCIYSNVEIPHNLAPFFLAKQTP